MRLTIASWIKIYGSFISENGGPSKHEMNTDQLRSDFVNIGCDVSYHKDLYEDVSPQSTKILICFTNYRPRT